MLSDSAATVKTRQPAGGAGLVFPGSAVRHGRGRISTSQLGTIGSPSWLVAGGGGGNPVVNPEICTRSSLAAMALVTVSLAGGCGSGDISGTLDRSSPAPASSHAEAPVKPSLPLGTRVKLPTGNTIAVIAATWWTPTAGRPRPGHALLTVRAAGCASARNATTTYLYEDDFTALLDDGSLGNVDYSAPNREPMLAASDLRPGDCFSGWVTLEVPTGRTPVAVSMGGNPRFDVSSVGPAR